MKYTFMGGVHPYDGKELSKDKEIRVYEPKGEVAIFLSQHIGAPAKALVKKGDRVLKGQLIAEAGGFVSANIHSSVSGTVKAIDKRRTPTGDMADAVIIDNDGLFESVDFEEVADPSKLSGEEILKRISAAGIVGMGGAGFPTQVKLAPKEPDKIDHIIANCAECEPYLTSDYRMMLEHGDELVGGMEIILSLFPNAKGVIAIEDNKPDCIEHMGKLCEGHDRISVYPLITKYPQGSERQLINAVTKRRVTSKMLPADAGCIVNNADTMIAVFRAVAKGQPLMERIVTMTGDGIEEPVNLQVPVGTQLTELIEAAGGAKEGVEKIICGGPMMGFAMFDTGAYVTKTTSALLFMKEDQVSKEEPSPCINCGRCVDACPSRILPVKLAVLADNGDEEAFREYNGMECMECGCCSYVCPAKRQLTQSIKTMRRQCMRTK